SGSQPSAKGQAEYFTGTVRVDPLFEAHDPARMIEELGSRAIAIKCNVTQALDVKAALSKTIETFGRLDFAFNNAGVEQKNVATAQIEESEWDRIVDIDLRGVFLCMKYEIPLLLKQGGGAIMNTSSGAGVIGIKGKVAYTAAEPQECKQLGASIHVQHESLCRS
ncbi:SDR family NAD(P)-dependent oxidoreductase, partial [Nostoc sp.]|uniref:SDR family NAD(P)-dependent oxidoreductase n=1 Tax=Nostoc sp. TaxID=1180 RepID=UPI002FF58794